jgi:hypothetical protein
MKRSALGILSAILFIPAAHAADSVEIQLAGTRTHFAVSEPIELAILYRNDGGNARSLPVVVRHTDGSTVTYTVPFDVAAGKPQTRVLNFGNLKPGLYTASVRVGEVERQTTFQVYSDQHPNAYWTAQWVHHGETWGTVQAKGGWMYMNSDLATLHPRKPKKDDLAEAYVAASMKPFARMVLGGGHQLDLELVNDWGDPWVQRTIIWRMQLAALSNRIYPIAGLHCYDEPGLTWWPTKAVGQIQADTNPFSIPHQLEAFTKLTGRKMPEGPFAFTGPQYALQMDDWLTFMDMRMKYLEQAWVATRWGTDSVESRFATINQVSSSYAPGTTTDGVDSRQARPYAIVSGHGGYSDLPFGTMQPVRSAMGYYGYTWDRPHYFLPMWYTHTWATIRNAVWMSWTTKPEGIMYTPEQDFGLSMEKHGYHGTHTVFEIAEINRKLALVGGVMNRLPRALSPVAVLHSHRQFAHDIATLNSPKLYGKGSPQYASPHRNAVDQCFFRVMETGLAPNWIDESEAAEKGAAFLKQWKVILCPRLATATPEFRKALEDYAAGGGKLIQFKGDKLLLKGSILAEHEFGDSTEYYLEKVQKAGGFQSVAYRDLSWRKWSNDFAPTFARDLTGWLGERPYRCENTDVVLGTHAAKGTTWLLFANNAQSLDNPRGVKHELIPTSTRVFLPPGSVVYDAFNGGRVPVENGRADLTLAAGDGACWVRREAPIPPISFDRKDPKGKAGGIWVEGTRFEIQLAWEPYLPFRVRIIDPAGNTVEQLYRGTSSAGSFAMLYWPGANGMRGKWTVEVSEWMTGSRDSRTVTYEPPPEGEAGDVSTHPVVIEGPQDHVRIKELLSRKPFEPPYDKLNRDSKRVFGLDSKKFAVFGPEAPAQKIADALKAKGMTGAVNPKYEIKPFEREPNRGGAGVTHGVASNLENIYAHTIVLPGHPLLTQSLNRGHINREATAVYPGPGRASIQWGIGCYQAGWQNIFVQGDVDVGVTWLLGMIDGKKEEGPSVEKVNATVRTVPAAAEKLPRSLKVVSEKHLPDTPVGIGTSPDGATLYVLLYDGTALAFDRDGKQLWKTQEPLEGGALAVSPKGDRVAVAGYPGLLVLDAASGKVLGGHRTTPVAGPPFPPANCMVGVAWNDAGTLAAAGWGNNDPKSPLPVVVLDAAGKEIQSLKDVAGNVYGVAFVPGSDTLLVGADQLTAVSARDGKVLWRNAVKGAQAFAFFRDGKTAAAGGWGKNAGIFDLASGTVKQTVTVPAVVGGLAFLPDGSLAIAVWGGTNPLEVLHPGAMKTEKLFAGRFGFQSVAWSPEHKALVAAEQGGRLWLLSPDGTPLAKLTEDAGTTAYRLLAGKEIVLARMNRVVQRVQAP